MLRYIFGVAVFLAGTTQLFAADKFPVGDWYNEGEHVAYRIISLTHIKSDGSFATEFRECHFNPPRDHIESGHWSMSGDHFEVTTESVWNRSTYYTSQYKTLSYDNHLWIYELSGGDALRMFGPGKVKTVKVTADSKMPGCDITS